MLTIIIAENNKTVFLCLLTLTLNESLSFPLILLTTENISEIIIPITPPKAKKRIISSNIAPIIVPNPTPIAIPLAKYSYPFSDNIILSNKTLHPFNFL